MKSILFLIIFLMPFYSSAQNAKDKFSVVIEGTRSHLDYIKARSELRMARSTKFCRGSKMPKSVGEWSCKSTAPRVSNCVLEYKCKFVNKRFNRASESRRLRSNLKGIPHLKSKYTISLLYKDKKQILEEIDNQVPTPAPSKKVVASSFSSQKLKSTKPKPKVKIRKKQITKVKKRTSSQKKKITKRKIETSEEDLEELSFLKESEEKNSLESETVSPLEEDQNIEESQFETKTHLKNFALSYISISDSEETSLTTFGLAWTPHIWFTEHFALRGNFGFHSYETVETDFVESQSFLIYDIAAYGQYLFTNLFFEVGYGTQKWNLEGAESVSSLSFGAGYLFDEKLLYVLDRVSLEMSSLSNEVSTKELKLNIGASF